MKKLLCFLLSAIFLAGCTNAVQPAPTPTATPSSTPEATATPAQTPRPWPVATPEESMPHPMFIPEEQLVMGSGKFDALDPNLSGVGMGKYKMSKELSDAVGKKENEGKYLVVAADVDIFDANAILAQGQLPSEWFAQRGFRILRDDGYGLVMVCKWEMIYLLTGECPGTRFALASWPQAGKFSHWADPTYPEESEDVKWAVELWNEMMERQK